MQPSYGRFSSVLLTCIHTYLQMSYGLWAGASGCFETGKLVGRQAGSYSPTASHHEMQRGTPTHSPVRGNT